VTTRTEQLENALLSIASHGRVLLSLAKAGALTAPVIETSEALFAAAAELATAEDEPPSVPVACAHPDDARVSFASAGNDDFFCRACQQHVARPLAEVA